MEDFCLSMRARRLHQIFLEYLSIYAPGLSLVLQYSAFWRGLFLTLLIKYAIVCVRAVPLCSLQYCNHWLLEMIRDDSKVTTMIVLEDNT